MAERFNIEIIMENIVSLPQNCAAYFCVAGTAERVPAAQRGEYFFENLWRVTEKKTAFSPTTLSHLSDPPLSK